MDKTLRKEGVRRRKRGENEIYKSNKGNNRKERNRRKMVSGKWEMVEQMELKIDQQKWKVENGK